MRKWGKEYGREKISRGIGGKKNKKGQKGEENLVSGHRSLRFKLVVSFLIPIAFIIILGVVSFQKAADGIRSSYEASTGQAIKMTGEYIQFGVDSMDSLSIQYTNDDNVWKYASGFYKDDLIKNNEMYQNLTNAALAKEVTDKFISSISVFSGSVQPITTVAYVKPDVYTGFLETEEGKIVEDNQPLWVGRNAYLDEKMGTTSKNYALRMIRKFKKANSLIVIDMDYNTVSDILKRMEFNKGSIIGLVTPDGQEIMFDGQNAYKSSFTGEAFYKEASASEKPEDSFYIEYQGEKQLFIYSKLGKTGALLCAMIPRSVILGKADGIKNVTIVIVIIACIVAVVTGLFISSGIDTIIKKTILKLKKAAGGDLTVDFTTKRKDEFQILLKEISRTFSNMKELISQVRNLSINVSGASSDVTITSEKFLHSAEDISLAMKEIEQSLMQQAKDAEECLSQMDQLSGQIVMMGKDTDEISKITSNTKTNIQNSADITRDLTEQTRYTIDITTNIVRGIENLAQKSSSIGSIINTINEISNQTNLLSLNASIEAARAGQYGRGFAVVASEIRTLATQITHSVDEIGKIINTIQSDTKELVVSAKNAETVLVQQDTAVKNTSNSYEVINESVDNLMLYLNNIVGDVGNIEKARSSTLNAIENISAVLEEIAASSNHVSQISMDQLEQVKTLNNSAVSLNTQSETLVNAVQQFTVS